MAYTYTVQDGLTLASKMAQDIPVAAVDETICDIVCSTMWRFRPWSESIQNITPGSLPLVDGTQDYNAPSNIYRLTNARICRTDSTPDQYNTLNVAGKLEPDLNKVSWMAIRAISHEPSLGKLRLDAAVQVTSPFTAEIQGEYQINPTKITALTQGLWFKDQYLEVFAEGLVYWMYRLGKDDRAGTTQVTRDGYATYTGQLGRWYDAMQKMASEEEFASSPQIFPDSPLGSYGLPGLRIFGAY